ncbi:helicase [Helicobacter bizzozeronii CIII-1]|uniref:DNA 3'-5' helicase n=1 Tax=Helicobacter bizzozeronii (strain CIII-1) TaxID=1002804 RepID=F8KRR0_HELBC|nr:RecB-like helicase [Helicobacter bizzozeronii]CCB79447.1 helicase [Helicobacter bizzozeronii CIII-1]
MVRGNFSSLALRASAGSGKTFHLTLRFVASLLREKLVFKNNASAFEILTLTFTNKAAAEMSERIGNALQELLAESQAYLQNPSTFDPHAHPNSLSAELKNKYGITLEMIAPHMASIHQSFLQDRLQITTIDAFLQKILRKFSYFVGVSAHFKVGHLDSQDKLNSFIATLKPRELQDLEQFCAQALDLSQSMRVVQILEPFLELYYQGIKKKHLAITPQAQSLKTLQEQLKQNWQALRLEVLSRVEGKIATNALKPDLEGLLDSLKPLMEGSQYKFFKKFKLQDLDPKFKALLERLKEYYTLKEATILQKLGDLLDRYDKHTHSPQHLDFASIALKAHQLLEECDWESFANFFYFRLDTQIRHILLDEFQDTSILQYQILKPMIDEILAGKGQKEGRSVFLVGDSKQSIYGFRGSYSLLFDRLCADTRFHPQSLPHNFRSDKIIMDFVNESFKLPIKDYEYQELPPESPPHKQGGYVKVIQVDHHSEKTDLQAEMLRSAFQEVLTLLKAGIAPHTIALLCFKNDDVRALKDHLLEMRENCAELQGVEIVSDADMGLLAQKEVKIMLYALQHALATPKHQPYYQACILKLLGLNLDTPLTLPPFMELSPYLFALMQELELYSPGACYLLELSLEYSNAPDFLEALEKEKPAFSQSNTHGITLMTIHKSKGLEFDHVILLDRLGGVRPNTNKFFTTYQHGTMQVFYKQKHRELVDEDYNQALEEYQETQKRENTNVLYVACTRAKHSLIIIQKPDKSAFKPLELKPLQRGSLACIQEPPQDEPKSYDCQNTPSLLESQESFGEQSDHLRQEPPIEENPLGMLFGIILHKALELHYGYGVHLEEVQAYLSHHYGFGGIEIAKVLARVQRLQKAPPFLELLKGRMAVEVGFKIQRDIWRMDMLLFEGDQITILDFKSGEGNLEANRAQVRGYKECVGRIYPQKRVQAALIYALSNKIEVSPI